MPYRGLHEESVSNRLLKAQVAKVLFLVPFLLLLAIFFRYQVLHTTEYSLHSEENRLRRIELPPPRGLITDRNGMVLAENIPSYSIELYPQPIDSMRIALERLAVLLDLDPGEQEQLVQKYRLRTQSPLRVATDIDEKTLAVVEEHRSEFPGIFIRSDMKRSYVYGEKLAHILGYVGEINENELEDERYKDYIMGSLIGRSGIEAQYESLLHGERGVKFVEVDAHGRELGPFRDKPPILPVIGEDIQLTIDLRLQEEMHRIMEPVEIGATVAMDPNNGEILAIVSKPDFDPNRLSSGISGAEFRELLFHPNKPFLNRVIQGLYPPGSTFKVFTALVGTDLDFINPEGKSLEITCRGGLQFGKRFFGCWKAEGHGKIEYKQAIVQSCDTFFYQLGIKIGLERFCQYGKESQFFEKTGIDLPNEESGLVPDEIWYNRNYGRGNWGPGNMLNLAIGQGEISLSPLQLANLYAAICNAGKRFRPHLLKEKVKNYRLSDIDFAPEHIAMLREPLTGVVNGPLGTARGSRLWGHERKMAGKTGTSQNPHGDDHGLFVGFYPADVPEIVVSAVVEHGLHGSAVARYVRDLILAYIEIKVSREQSELAKISSTNTVAGN